MIRVGRPQMSKRRALPSGAAKISDGSMPDDVRHFRCRRRVAAALSTDDAVDDGHADAGEVAGLHAVEQVLAGGMPCDRCNNSRNPAKSS